ncbi:phosphotransferase [Microbacterium sp. MC2]
MLTAEDVADVLRRGYELDPIELSRLGSEIADTFLVVTGGGRYVVKAHHVDTDDALRVFEWQGEVQRLLHATGQPVPDCVLARDGRVTYADRSAPTSFAVLVMEWADGQPLIQVEADSALLHRIGAAAGRFHRTLQSAPPPPVASLHDWDVRRLEERLETCIPLLGASSVQQACAWALGVLKSSHAMERLAALPAAMIHQDLNDSNILLTPERGIAAILDFGDMTSGPRVAEVAVLAAYLSRRASDPAPAIGDVLAGFESEVPMDVAETSVVMPLVAGRLALNLASNALRVRAGRRAEYANERITGSYETLERLSAAGLSAPGAR